MSGVDVYKLLEDMRKVWGHLHGADLAIVDCIAALRAAEERGYLGTLYRTDYEVEGSGAFPIDMLRYTCSWPSGEVDSQAIEDSCDDAIREAAPRRGKRTIALSRYHRDPEPNLAADRWAAKFRWRVVRRIETVSI